MAKDQIENWRWWQVWWTIHRVNLIASTYIQRPAHTLFPKSTKEKAWLSRQENSQFWAIVASHLTFLCLLLANILNILFYLFGCAGSWVFPGSSEGKESACNARDQGLIPGMGRYPGEGNAYHSSILAWRIPWREEPGRLQSKGLQRVGHEWATNTNSLRETDVSPRSPSACDVQGNEYILGLLWQEGV